ncbi:TonB-dependent receptor [Novosphingobium album (ex Liu et al. 2023)]|uniref:TonB-dependent receptor n=1 Tax=Novosphingobium album (ex Liu et al. 2023) TaxID=3031130 RepID=A0ABT5WNS9_9SPHN|nr:TonB-dependent receptor [Novosphingobium album (ex Liu et al. 2023)]MDE8651698.1 TonB-dependent receptor [Novosphingobium album (ex Liu et al. 2023)]
MHVVSWASLGAMATALGAMPAMAADAPPDPTIVVTAPSTTPFDLAPAVDKIGTSLFDSSRSIQVVQRELIDQQGATQLRDTLRNVSGLVQGGQFSFGFYDRFVSRGLNVTFLNDGLPDTTSDLGGYVHGLTGVERVEVLKGPGSALFGTTAPGGTINLVHYRPTDTFAVNGALQYGSFETITANASLNAPLASGVSARLDGGFQHSDGQRGRRNKTGEVYGSLGFHPANHDIIARLEYHRIEIRPDSIGLPFSPPSGTGLPADVDRGNRYYTPFAYADQTIKRAFLSDAWTLNESLVVNLRAAYTDRDVDLARNAGGRLTAAGSTYSLTGRQLRQQTDNIHDFVVQAEPTWHFSAGAMPVTLLAGFEYRKVSATTRRATADLPNIADIRAPVTPETSLAALNFLCDRSHSCNDADIDGRFHGLYAMAQIDLTPRLKLRLSGREDWFRTSAEGRSAIPVNPGSEHPCDPPQATTCAFVPGQPVVRKDDRFEWDVGAVYQLADAFALFGGYASNSYPIFNTEEPQSIGQVPEKGTQIEAGLRVRQDKWLALSSSLFRTTRKNVYTIILVDNLDVSQVFSYRVKGWETDLTLRPVPAWNIIANFTLQDPVLVDYPQNPGQIGNRVPSVPKRIGNVWTSYDLALPEAVGTLQFAAGLRYRSAYFGDTGETRTLPGATMIDLSAALLHGPWTVRAGVSNIGDKRNYDYAAGTGSGAIPGQGRTFFVSLAAKAL